MSEEDKLNKDNISGFSSKRDNEKVNNLESDFLDNESDMKDADEDLLALLDMISTQDYNSPYEEDLLSVHPTEVNEEPYISYSRKEDDDIIALDEQVSSYDTKEYSSFDEEESVDNLLDNIMGLDNPSVTNKIDEVEVSNADVGMNDLGGVFSNVLSAVDSLDDKIEIDSIDLRSKSSDQKSGEKQKKLSLFQRIFGSKKEKDIEKVTKEAKEKEAKEIETKEKKVKGKKAKVKKTKEKKATTKDSKSSNSKLADTDEQLDSPKKSKAKTKKAKKDKKKTENKKIDKKKSEPKIKRTKKAKEVVEEATEDMEVYKVSKLAIVFIATFIILISGFVTLGTNSYSYTLSLNNAKTNFERERYTEAYYDIYGLDVRNHDQETYDKIMTVMYVNKELNSYNNYLKMNKNPEALDSLLKGLERYDKYIDRAKELDIKKNLDSIRASILDELANKYGVTEKEAKKLNAIEDQTQYSIDVISIAIENVKKVASE